jgi:hypothetical protein
MGVPGFALWASLNLVFAASLWKARRVARASGQEYRAAFIAWLLLYWLAMSVNGAFSLYLEAPQQGIWYWTVFGLGLVVLRDGRPRRPRPVLGGTPQPARVAPPSRRFVPVPAYALATASSPADRAAILSAFEPERMPARPLAQSLPVYPSISDSMTPAALKAADPAPRLLTWSGRAGTATTAPTASGAGLAPNPGERSASSLSAERDQVPTRRTRRSRSAVEKPETAPGQGKPPRRTRAKSATPQAAAGAPAVAPAPTDAEQPPLSLAAESNQAPIKRRRRPQSAVEDPAPAKAKPLRKAARQAPVARARTPSQRQTDQREVV